MFCPSCSSEERQPNQYCRACGTDLRSVRAALERPDEITASAASARDEIGHAIAAKVKEMKSARDLHRIAEDVLPKIEKFLESPEEKRLRRVRSGVVTASIGFAATLLFFFYGLMVDKGMLLAAGAGLITFFIGLGLVLNGLLFTVAQKKVPDNSLEARRQNALDQSLNLPDAQTAEIALPAHTPVSSSVTEHTTHQLPDKPEMLRG